MPKTAPKNADGKTPPSPSDRTTAAKLRLKVKVGQPLTLDEAAWLETYEDGQNARAEAIGASQAKRVSYTEEETQNIGTGEAAMTAVGAATMAREEGRRYDMLLTVGIQALRTATDTYGRMVEQILSRNAQLEKSHVEMMVAMRTHFLARVEAEADAERLAKEIEGGEEKDGIGKLAEQLLPYLVPGLEQAGIELPKKG